jgi:protease-4
MFAATQPFSDDEWSIVNSWLDQIYADFTTKVASGRSLSEAEVEAVARGRIWLGADAVHNGLADQLGGLAEAAVTARRRGGLPADAPLRIFPRGKPLDQLRQHDSSEDRAASLPGGVLSGLAAVLSGGAGSGFGSGFSAGGVSGAGSAWGVAGQVAAQLTGPPAGELMMPGYWRVG